MTVINDLIIKALNLQKRGLNVEQIANELKIARETAIWLLNYKYSIKKSQLKNPKISKI